MNMFEVGEHVTIKGSEECTTGFIVRVCAQSSWVAQQYEVCFKGDVGSKYCYEYELQKVSDSDKHGKSKCECGAVSALGLNCSSYEHSFWCPMSNHEEYV